MVFFISLGFLQRRETQADSTEAFVGPGFHFFQTWVALSVYEAYWGLDEKPFENTPDPRFLYRSPDLEDLYTRLLYTLSSRHGAACHRESSPRSHCRTSSSASSAKRAFLTSGPS